MFLNKILRAADHPYLMGSGGRKANNALSSMQGLTVKSLKHHVALQPLFIIMGAGVTFVCAYVGRLAMKSTDVNWSKKKDPVECMQVYENKQFKTFNVGGVDHSNLSTIRNEPVYR
eukprot:TRINITY_DN5267_c0_g1_i2.p2 TRINITY_DN5267_c0_g1~~TRINITY_DN5267_c0_g1_i2.p2  ORF type:complete len:116 (-),score=30.20 TRINITY_DN5267_c0_g1_i2:89-436(-)